MRLFVLPGACSLASHIAIEWIRATAPGSDAAGCEVEVIQRGRNHEPDYRAINPLGTVPALVTNDGQLIVESLAVLLHLADEVPECNLASRPGTPERDRLHRLLSIMVTAAHPAFQMLWRSERFADTPEGAQAVVRSAEARLDAILARLDGEVANRPFLVGDHPTVADFYLFVLGRWGLRLGKTTPAYSNLWRLTLAIDALTATRAAMAREAISLTEPRSGLG